MARLWAAVIVIVALCLPGRGLAHPHIFIEQRLAVVFDDKGLSGIHVRWQFDDMFSAMIATDHDRDKDQSLDPEEIADIKANAFSYISQYHYFFTVHIGDSPFPVTTVTDFTAELDRGRLIYEFFIPCPAVAGQKPQEIKIAAYDPEYYTAIRFAEKKPYEMINAEGFRAEAAVREDKETLIYFDMVNPWTLFLELAQK